MIEERLTLLQKLAGIRKLAEVIQKDKSGYNYKYVSIDEILAKVTAGMKKYGVSLIPSYQPETATVEQVTYKKTKVMRDGKVLEDIVNEYIAKSSITYTWIDDETGDKLIIPWFIAGSQTDPSQALGSAMTYGLRQFMVQYFQIAQPADDPDSWRSKQKEAEDSEKKEIAAAITDQINAFVNDHLVSSPDDRAAVMDLIKKYARDANGKATMNYKAIVDPQIASALLEALTSAFKKG